MQYVGIYYNKEFTGDFGLIMTGDGFGIAYRQIKDFFGVKYKEYIYGIGIGLGRNIYWGGSYRYVKEGYDYYNKRHFWNIGLIYHYGSQITLGAVFSNLNRGKIGGQKSEIEELYSVSYTTYNEMLVLSVEATLSSGQSLSSARYNYGIDFRFRPNMTIYGNLNSDKHFQIGFKVPKRSPPF